MIRFLVSILLAAATLAGYAHDDVTGKLSVTTQMFLDELEGRISLDAPAAANRRLAPGIHATDEADRVAQRRLIAAPDTIGGRAYISAFVRLADNGDVRSLERLGVEVQCRFDNGLVTANIPVDKLRQVAALGEVRRVSVARQMNTYSDKARQATHTDAVLTRGYDAVAAGLDTTYDGSGVLLAIIDTGIDFEHIAFEDKDGNTRITGAYIYDGTSAVEYVSGKDIRKKTDDFNEDHGTHTASTAGGSSVMIIDDEVTVTDDHANATLGGMAPGADLYLAGINGLKDTYIANAFQKICACADARQQPVVVSNSWGNQLGPHDGTGEMAEIIDQYFGDSHPNHICLFASSNEAGHNGFHLTGTSSSEQPLGAVVNTTLGSVIPYYSGVIASAWARSADASDLVCKVLVLDKDGNELTSATVAPEEGGTLVELGEDYVMEGAIAAYYDFVEGSKPHLTLLTQILMLQNITYKLAVQIYPREGSTTLDVWSSSGYSYFSAEPATPGYTWTAGSDDMTLSDEATFANVITVGAYVTKNSVTDYKGTGHNLSSVFPTVGDIAYFSSYATAEQSPTGQAGPWITAPGATIVAAVNPWNKSGDYSFMNGNSELAGMYRVNDDDISPYGSMNGTSMATPVAAGIVALWMQAAQEVGKELTVGDVKRIMQETARHDSYVLGSHASHFGNGKIDAVAGLAQILGTTPTPALKAEPTELAFKGYVGQQQQRYVNVTGIHLTNTVEASLTGSSDFTLSLNHEMWTEGSSSLDYLVTWTPTEAGTSTATLTLTSAGAEDVSVTLSGNAEQIMPGEPCPQVVWCEGSGTLFFVYRDTNYAQAGTYLGQAVSDCWIGPEQVCRSGHETETPGWADATNSDIAQKATRVVIDPSFAKVRPASTSMWFLDFAQLTDLEGMEYLNTSGVITMKSMFEGCSKLTAINIDLMDFRMAKDGSRMFAGCSMLETIYFEGALRRVTLTDVFAGCDKLDTSQTSRYSPTNGVFTTPTKAIFEGSGTETDPYLISNETDWNHLVARTGHGIGYSGSHFLLTADLAFDDYFTTDHTNCSTVGYSEVSFEGNFDGDGHTISGIRWTGNIVDTDDSCVGLFGALKGARVRNLTLDNCVIVGNKNVGSVVGIMLDNCVLENCHVTASCEVHCGLLSGFRTGGLVGTSWGSTMEGCTTAAQVLLDDGGSKDVGGLAGFISGGSVKNSLYLGSRIDRGNNAGALVGYMEGGMTQNCYYTYHGLWVSDIGHREGTNTNEGQGYTITLETGIGHSHTTTVTYTAYEGKPAIAVYDNGMLTYEGMLIATGGMTVTLTTDDGAAAGDDAIMMASATDSQAGIDCSNSLQGNLLTMPSCDVTVAYAVLWGIDEGADGSDELPYLVRNCAELNALAARVNAGHDYAGKHFLLVNNLDYQKAAFTPIGTASNTSSEANCPFNATFDGGGKTVKGMRIGYDEAKWCQGVFGYVGSQGTVKRLKVQRTEVKGTTGVGGIAGSNEGIITDCVVEQSVNVCPFDNTALTTLGGIAGINMGGTISGCYSSAQIGDSELTESNRVQGGIVGWNILSKKPGMVRDCMASSVNIYGFGNNGAIVGLNEDGCPLANNYYDYCHVYPLRDGYEERTTSIGSGGTDVTADNGAVQAVSHAFAPSLLGNKGAEYPTSRLTGYGNGLGVGTQYELAALVLDDDADNTPNIKANGVGNTPRVILQGRTLYRDGSWNTLCLPMTLGSLEHTVLEDATVKELESAAFDEETGTLTLNFSEGSVTSITHDRPYIVRWETKGEPLVNPTFDDVSVYPHATPLVEAGPVNFVGTFAPVTFAETDHTVLYLGEDNTLYYPDPAAGETFVIGAMRAYFTLCDGLTAGTPATIGAISSFRLNFGDEETGIRSLTPAASSEGEGRWYTLDGRRVMGKPGVRGLYVHRQGQKVFFE